MIMHKIKLATLLINITCTASLFAAGGGINSGFSGSGGINQGPATSNDVASAGAAMVGGTNNFTGVNSFSGVVIANNPSNRLSGFNSFKFFGLGDSLTTTNASASVSYPTYLALTNGYTVVTNDAIGGTSSGAILARFALDYSFFPISLGSRCAIGICVGKNDMFNMTLSQSNTVANSILVNTTNIINIAKYAGLECVLITQPYSVGSAYPAYTNIEPCRQIVNNTLLSMTNYSGVLGIVNFDAVAPITTWTNSDGTINTNTTLDGLHPVNSVNLTLASYVNNVLVNSSFSSNSSSVRNPNTRYIPQTNASPNYVYASADGQGTARQIIGDDSGVTIVENNWNGANGIGGYGSSLYDSRDLSNGTLWAWYILNAAATKAIVLDPNGDGIFVGVTAGNLPNNPTSWVPPANGFKFYKGTLTISNVTLNGTFVVSSNAWSVTSSITNTMPNFSTAFHVSSNGTPVDIYMSNSVPFIYYETSANTGILP